MIRLDVNNTRSVDMALSTSCAGIKGFKGKGADWVNQVRASLAEIHATMRALSKETRAIRGHDFALVVHSRGKNGQKFLRWRLAVPPYQHVTWETVVAHLVTQPPALAQWYRQANAAALALNYQEMAVRHELHLAQRCQQHLILADKAYEESRTGCVD